MLTRTFLNFLKKANIFFSVPTAASFPLPTPPNDGVPIYMPFIVLFLVSVALGLCIKFYCLHGELEQGQKLAATLAADADKNLAAVNDLKQVLAASLNDNSALDPNLVSLAVSTATDVVTKT